MARSWQNARWRRILMQVVLWAIFAGTVGLAELVTRERTHTARAELSQARTIDHLTLRLPGKWIVSNGADGSNTLLVAHEPASGLGHGEGRTLTLSRQRARGASSTQEFLLQSGLLHGALSMGEDADPDGEDGGGPVAPAPAEAAAMQPLKMGGWPAVMTTVYRPHISPMGFSASLHKQVIAAALLPSHQAVVLTLESAMALQPTAEFPDDSAGGEDAVMVRQIAEGMRIDGEQSWQKESTLTLSSGLSVTLPDGWLLSPAVDSNRTRRAIALERDNSMRVEINPCVLLPDDGPDVVRSMLLASHPELCGAKLTRDDAGRWHAQWPGASAMGSRASGARAIGRADGNSVLLVFFGAPIESGDFNDAFETMSASAKVVASEPPNYAEMLKTGDAETKRLMAMPRSAANDKADADEWWTLRDTADTGGGGGSTTGNIGWIHEQRDDTAEWAGRREARWRVDKQVTLVIEHWTGDAGLSNYRYDLSTRESNLPRQAPAAAEQDAPFTSTADQSTLLHNGKLAMRAHSGSSELIPPSGPPPIAYAPGGWLAGMLGQLPAEPMVIQTESLTGFALQGVPLPRPIRLIVTPGGPSRATDNGRTALRCVTVEISGTGALLRFYYRPDGVLDSVDYPDDLQQTRSDEATVKFQFGGDRRMLP